MDWNVELISRIFNARDQKCILALPLSWREPKDALTWAFSKDGLYSTKNAYMLGKGCNFDDFHQVWVFIWSLEVSPKVRHFLWRFCTGTLPTKGLLMARHMIEEAFYPWCGEVETSFHAIFECVRVEELWEDCGCSSLRARAVGDLCELVLSWKNASAKLQQRAAYLAWCVWGDRNKKVFEGTWTPNGVLAARVGRLVEEFGLYSKKIYTSNMPKAKRSSKIWKPPPAGAIKINVDASLAVEGWVGMGVIARDCEGKVLMAATRRVCAWLAKAYGFNDIIVETDCQGLVNRLSKADVFLSDLDNVLEDVLSLSLSFNSIAWSHVRRDGNFVAHHLAKLLPSGVKQVWVNHCPPEISPYVLSDILSFN
ncbi:uncharacterized protein LOC110705260 [Chenopodium quinoa]|uniref:uncharacterized protein LOC110705260 n=1 Tax=Chenopodium quinoa TaxID=63459 RepID=UPI000B782341|nr:uncharacterized protein LOC110705260 [Chenopodium quinoa]